jgi:hypothetical protein
MSGMHGWPECLAKLSDEERTRWFFRNPERYVRQINEEARIAVYEGLRAPKPQDTGGSPDMH